MKQVREWHWIKERAPNALVNYVELGDQIGFPKFASLAQEKLASELARLICVPVAFIEIGSVAGNGRAAISYVHSLKSRPLRSDGPFASSQYSEEESAGLRSASGLLPFLTWIGSDDHAKDSNFVVDDLGVNGCRIQAIDFEHAFPWIARDELKFIVHPPKPPGMSSNYDCSIVSSTLERIERLGETDIKSCCVNSCFPAELIDGMTDVLVKRQLLIRPEIKKLGWLPV